MYLLVARGMRQFRKIGEKGGVEAVSATSGIGGANDRTPDFSINRDHYRTGYLECYSC